LPGFAAAHGVDGHAAIRFYLAIVAVTVVVPLLLRPLLARLRPSIAIVSWGFALWFATTDQYPLWVIAISCRTTRPRAFAAPTRFSSRSLPPFFWR
jgi:hypothetical protein